MFFDYILFSNDLIFMLPEFFFSISILFGISFFTILGNSKFFQKPFLGLVSGYFSLFILLFTFFLTFNNLDIENICFFFQFHNNFFINSVKLFLLFSCFFCIFFSLDFIQKDILDFFEFFIVIQLSVLGMLFLICSFSFISFYLSLELLSLSLYILASMKKNSNFSTEAGLKYFILGSLASCLLLFGITLIYGFTGLLFFDDLFLFNSIFLSLLDKSFFDGVTLGLLLFSIGLFFKIGAAPFHFWVIDVYEGVPLPVTAFFAIVPKIAFINFILLFFNTFFFSFFFFWNQWFIFLAFFSFIIGTFGAIFQIKIKRLLAYSAISQIGFLCLGFSLNTVESFQAVFFFIFIYVILSILIFSLIFCLRRFDNNLEIKNILHLKNFFKINPFFSILFCLAFFSLAGIPPLVGFFSKFFIFFASVKEFYYFFSLFSLIMSVISSFYYIRMIKLVFFDYKNSWVFLYPISKIFSFIIIIFSFFNLFFFVCPQPILIFCYKSVLFLYF